MKIEWYAVKGALDWLDIYNTEVWRRWDATLVHSAHLSARVTEGCAEEGSIFPSSSSCLERH